MPSLKQFRRLVIERDALREQLREADDVADKAALDGYENGLEFAEAEAESEIRRLTDALQEITELRDTNLRGTQVHPAIVIAERALAKGESDD